MIATSLVHLSRYGLAFALVMCFVLLGLAAIGMWMDGCPERDEDEELNSYYEQFRRLPQ